VGFLNSIHYEVDPEANAATLDEIQESIGQTGTAIKAVGDRVKSITGDVEKQDARIVVVADSVEKIVLQLENQNKSLETHINATRAALKQLPAGKSSGFIGNSPWKTSANSKYAVNFASEQACKAFGLLVMGHCAHDLVVRERMKSFVEKAKDEPFFGAVFKALEAGDHARAGATVPDEMLSELIRNIEEHGEFQQNARRMPMGAGILIIPRRTSGLTIFYPDENVDITDSDPNTDDVMLTARLYATLTKWSNELLEDTAIDFGVWMGEEIVDAHALARDTNGFTGTGQSTQARVTGVLAQSDVVTHILGNAIGGALTNTTSTSFSDITFTDLALMQGLVPTKSQRNAKWYMHRHILAIIKSIVTSAGDPVVVDRDTALGGITSLLGDPVVPVDVLPNAADDAVTTDFFAYGDLRLAYGFGERRALRILNSAEAGFSADQTWIRSTARVAISAMDGTQLVKGRTSTT